jgi:hypothetical protein
MGCRTIIGKIDDIKKTLSIFLIVTMFVVAVVTPVVFGANEHADYIVVTFTPSGDIELDVTNGTAVFGSVAAGTVNATIPGMATSGSYTLYNNGTVAAHVYIWTNETTNGSSDQEWTLDNDGTPGIDNFCLKRWNNSGGNGFIRNLNTSWIDNLAGGGGTILFGVTLQLGTASDNDRLVAQLTRINITGVIAT